MWLWRLLGKYTGQPVHADEGWILARGLQHHYCHKQEGKSRKTGSPPGESSTQESQTGLLMK